MDRLMEAGRELDALIAEKVIKGKPSGDLISCLSFPPYYSINIAAAWEVVEKMQASGWLWSVEHDDLGVSATFDRGRYKMEMDHHFQRAETVPHVICLAALKAVE